MNTNVMFSKQSDEWETPQDLFDQLDAEFHFDVDVAATEINKKCDLYLTSALNVDWGLKTDPSDGIIYRYATYCWCNPPYSKSKQFIAYAVKMQALGVTTVMLLPARTDTKAFHQYIYNQPGVEIRFLKGRLKFGGATNSAPFPSMIVVFRAQ